MAHRIFSPSEENLIDRYLRPMIAGKLNRSASSFMHDVDAYSDHPYDLVRNHKPAPGTGDGDGRSWYFFSPVRYASNKNASRRSGGTRRRSRTVGLGGTLGTWHSEGKKKTVKRSDGGGYAIESFSYRETTASGFVKPGWLMVEYGVLEQHGGHNIVLFKVYKSPRGPGSDVQASGRKRKAADVVVEHLAAPPTPSLRPWQRTPEDDEDHTLFADILECDLSESDDCAPPAYQESEHTMTGGYLQIVPGAAAGIVETSSYGSPGNDDKIEFMDAGVPVDEVIASWTSSECSALPILCTDDNDDRIELTDSGVTGDEELASWTSSECSTLPSLCTDYNDYGKIEFMDAGVTVDELLASSTSGECSGSPCPLTDDEDDDMMVGGLACPPMDHAYVEELLSAPDQRFDPAFVEEFLFRSLDRRWRL